MTGSLKSLRKLMKFMCKGVTVTPFMLQNPPLQLMLKLNPKLNPSSKLAALDLDSKLFYNQFVHPHTVFEILEYKNHKNQTVPYILYSRTVG